jgi:hypothetical protein
VAYNFPAETKFHYTGLAFILVKKPVGTGGSIKPDDKIIRAENMFLLPQPFGSGDAN